MDTNVHANRTAAVTGTPRSVSEKPLEHLSGASHRGRNQGIVAVVHTVLFTAGLFFVVSFTGGLHFPGPWEPGEVITQYLQAPPSSVLMCAFLQFGASVPLGIYTATVVSRLRFLGVSAAGPSIALFGGLATAFSMAT